MTGFLDLTENQQRQYIDAETVFDELRRVRRAAAQTRGGMFWREVSGGRYLIRTSRLGAQTSLGRESDETRAIHDRFIARKTANADRLAAIQARFDEQQRLNRALRVGRVPTVVVKVLNALERAGFADHFMVIGTHALYAYESAAGVRFESGAMATVDVDLLFDANRHMTFFSQMKQSQASLIGLLQQADKTFERLDDRKETARNQQGFEVDVIRRVARAGDPNPLRMSDDEGDVWAVQADSGSRILGSPRFSQMVVAVTGEMAMMHTMQPLDFVAVKRSLASSPSREPLKRRKDALQAELVDELVRSRLPQYLRGPEAAVGRDQNVEDDPAPDFSP